MEKYLSEETLKATYDALTLPNYSNPNEVFYLLIFKYAGISQTRYIDLNDEETKDKLVDAVKKLSYLYIDESREVMRAKRNFINPLSMNKWAGNPADHIRMWTTNRLKNNVTGGSPQWRELMFDNKPDNTNMIKLKNNYLTNIDTDKKISLDALAIWIHRFTKFDEEVPKFELISTFKKAFHISNEEEFNIFNLTQIDVFYQHEVVKPSKIRGWIGNPENNSNWLAETKILEQDKGEKVMDNFSDTYIVNSIHTEAPEKTELSALLDKIHQFILVGPPGTSKSFLAKQISESGDFRKTVRVQFHPQYTYQDFIGGKIIEEGSLVDKKGILIDLIEEAIDNKELNYLLIIEEINRANVSQVFGELIQLLDRDENLILTFNNNPKSYYLPKNLKIIGTMNSTDRTLGRIDFAIKRRFFEIYCEVDYELLAEKVRIENNLFSVDNFLKKLNYKLVQTLNNTEMVIGHAIFMKEFVYNNSENIYKWPLEDFKQLFYYSILPLIKDYCGNNQEVISSIVGDKLTRILDTEEFVEVIGDF